MESKTLFEKGKRKELNETPFLYKAPLRDRLLTYQPAISGSHIQAVFIVGSGNLSNNWRGETSLGFWSRVWGNHDSPPTGAQFIPCGWGWVGHENSKLTSQERACYLIWFCTSSPKLLCSNIWLNFQLPERTVCTRKSQTQKELRDDQGQLRTCA